MKRILIGADIVPTEKNYDHFISGDAKALLGDELKEIFDRADYRIFNLETRFYNLIQITIGYSNYRYIKSV